MSVTCIGLVYHYSNTNLGSQSSLCTLVSGMAVTRSWLSAHPTPLYHAYLAYLVDLVDLVLVHTAQLQSGVQDS
jgi:hypothetical protein